MRKERAASIILTVIFLATALLRIWYSFQFAGFDDNSYFALRQVEHISQTGLPLYDDPLSYGGRSHIGFPLFHYILAFFNLFLPLELVGKIIPNIFASLIIFGVYLTAREVTDRREISMFIAAASSFVPVYFALTINSVSPLTLSIPLMFFMMYCFLRVKEKLYAKIFISLMIFSALLHPSSVLFALGLVGYLFLIRIDKVKHAAAETEAIIFAFVLIIWTQFIIYRRALLDSGAKVIWQNIPDTLLSTYFSNIYIGDMLYFIGIIPVFCGLYVVYRSLFKEKNSKLYLSFGFLLSIGAMLLFRLIQLKFGLAVIGILLAVLVGEYIKIMTQYMTITRFSRLRLVFLFTILTLFVIFSIIPAFSLASNQDYVHGIDALEWISENTPSSAVVFAPLSYGHAINAIAKRKNIADSNFLLIPDVEKRIEDLRMAYTTKFETQALSIFQQYDASYLILNTNILNSLGIESVEYIKNQKCFTKVFDGSAEVYQIKCRIH